MPPQRPTITVIIKGKDYCLNADNPATFNHLPKAERTELLYLLEAIKQERVRSPKAMQHALQTKPPAAKTAQDQASAGLAQAGRLGHGDADALMARLIQEESLKRKPGLSKRGIYKFVGISALLIFLLVMIF